MNIPHSNSKHKETTAKMRVEEKLFSAPHLEANLNFFCFQAQERAGKYSEKYIGYGHNSET